MMDKISDNENDNRCTYSEDYQVTQSDFNKDSSVIKLSKSNHATIIYKSNVFFEHKLSKLKKEMDKKMEEIDKKMDKKMEEMDKKMDKKMDDLRTKLTQEFSSLFANKFGVMERSLFFPILLRQLITDSRYYNLFYKKTI